MTLRLSALSIAILCFGSPALAQGTYVSASLLGDIVRFSHVEPNSGFDESGGEAFGFALRVGTPIGSSWGVEAEFARTAAIERDGVPAFRPLASSLALTWMDGAVNVGSGGAVFSGLYSVPPLPPIAYRFRSSYQDTTMSAAAWARQDFTAGFALVYVAGMAFHRTEEETEITFEFPRALPTLPIALPSPTRSEVIQYSTRPFVGLEGRIGMAGRVELVPGIRVHSLEGGVLVRPSIGLGWTF